MTRPNILLVVVDSLRADACLGKERTAVTPEIDRLARSGAVFSNSIASTSYTTPNFASLLTGRYSSGHGIRCFMDVLGDVPTLPELLSARGYSTHAEVTGPLRPAVGLDRGFSDYRYRRPEQTVHSAWGRKLVERIGDFPSPWFCLLHVWSLHQPRIAPRPFNRKRYGKTLYERSLSAFDRELSAIVEAAGKETMIVLTGDHGEYVPRTRIEDLADRYKFCYMRLKWMNGRLQGLLGESARSLVSRRKKRRDRKEISRSGLFQVMVPHGEHIYDYLIRTPLIVNYPNLFPAREFDFQFEQVDLLPTLLGSLGISFPEDLDGRNLYPAVRDGMEVPERPAYLECTYTQHRPEKEQWLIGLRTSRAKFIFAPFNDRVPPEYYDLERDPGESENRAGLCPELVEGHRRLALEYFSRGTGKKEEVSGREKAAMVETLRALGYLD